MKKLLLITVLSIFSLAAFAAEPKLPFVTVFHSYRKECKCGRLEALSGREAFSLLQKTAARKQSVLMHLYGVLRVCRY